LTLTGCLFISHLLLKSYLNVLVHTPIYSNNNHKRTRLIQANGVLSLIKPLENEKRIKLIIV
jgi:hypothetical protein